jgi:hypothetical protein
MKNPDHIFYSLETIFLGLKYLNSFDADPGWRQFGSGIRGFGIQDEKKSDPGSTSRIRNTEGNCY